MKNMTLLAVALIFFWFSRESKAQGTFSLNSFSKDGRALIYKTYHAQLQRDSMMHKNNNVLGRGRFKPLQTTETDDRGLLQGNSFINAKRLQKKTNRATAGNTQVYLIDTVINYSGVYYYDVPSLPDTIRYIFSYNAYGMATSMLIELWQNGQWTNSSLDTCTYNAGSDQLTDLNKQWQNGQWVNSTLDSSTYDANGNRLTYLRGYWTEGQWTNYTLDTYTYDSNGHQLTDMIQSWMSDYWRNENVYIDTYDARGDILTESCQFWQNGGQWATLSLDTFTYDAKGDQLSDLGEDWQDGHLDYEGKDTCTYDERGHKLTDLDEELQNGQWIHETLDTYTYDESGNQLTRLRTVWQDSLWTNYVLDTYTYDVNGHQLTFFSEVFQGGQWTNDLTDSCTYNANGYLNFFTADLWQDSTWVPNIFDGVSVPDGPNTESFLGSKVMISYILSSTTDISISQPNVSMGFSLSQNYPNPFNPSTNISFDIPSRSNVSLKIFDLLGREVATIVSEEMAAGSYTRQWNAMNSSSGVYFYRLVAKAIPSGQAGTYSEAKKLLLLK
jgi:hypothetical protein